MTNSTFNGLIVFQVHNKYVNCPFTSDFSFTIISKPINLFLRVMWVARRIGMLRFARVRLKGLHVKRQELKG
jgi:hypothetical protein